MSILKQVFGILASGYILMYYSEILFWARVRPEDSISEWISTWIVYSLLAYVFLTLLTRFRIKSIWPLFLAGAVFGWLAEGLIVQTVYKDIPLSISFTGLAWHALITIWVGWHAVRRALASRIRSTITLAAAIGFGYGCWSITWWVEPDGGIVMPLDFAVYSVLTSLLLIVAYRIYNKTIPACFTPNRAAEIVAAILFLLYFIFVTIPATSMAAFILPVLLAAVFLTLRHNKRIEGRGSLLDSTTEVDSAWHYLGLLVLPLTAIAIYTIAWYLGLRWHTNWVFYLITTPAGFVLLFVSLIKVWRMRSAETAVG